MGEDLVQSYQPNPVQDRFHRSPAFFRWFVGGARSGKSKSLCMEAIFQSLAYPNNLGVIARNTLVDLRRTTKVQFLQECIPPQLWKKGFVWREGEQCAIFPNGSQIFFIGLDEPGRLGSLDLGWWALEETSEYPNPNEIVSALMRQLARPGIGRRCAFAVGNPGGKDWWWQNFVSNPRPGWEHFKATPYDNEKNLPSDFISSLLASVSPEYARRYVYGEFIDFAGTVFCEFEEAHLIAPFKIPRHWIRYRGMDYGVREPTVCLWAAIDEAGRIFVYDEFYAKNTTIAAQVMAINLKTEKDEILATVLDARSAGLRQQAGVGLLSIADQYRNQGLFVVPSATGDAASVESGIMRIKGLLAAKKLFFMRPGVVEGRYYGCPEAIREMQTFSYAAHREGEPERDRFEGTNDHCISAVRYVLQRHLGSSILPIEERRDTVEYLLQKEDEWMRQQLATHESLF